MNPMRIPDSEIRTREVLDWKGLHLLHFQGSSCSQKVRILLQEKNISYVSHHINLPAHKHVTAWYLGINPRGVVPVLVHDGAVHVESNDILEYLDREIPSSVPHFFPEDEEAKRLVKESLDLEDALHMDLRSLTMGFMVPKKMTEKSAETLERYEKEGADDPKRAKEVAWWRRFAEEGIPDDVTRKSVSDFRAAFDILEARLESAPWLLGENLSILDIAWFISVIRVQQTGYPLASWHPKLNDWQKRLYARPSFREQTSMGFLLSKVIIPTYQTYRALTGTTLQKVIA